MKRIFCFILALSVVFSFAACSGKETTSEINSEEVIGNDWHVWGMYTFEKVGDLKIAISKVENEEKLCIGYDIYADGESRGALLCEIRCEDGGVAPEEMLGDSVLVYRDYNADGLEDIGVPLKNGDILWYLQSRDEYGDSEFTFCEVQKGV